MKILFVTGPSPATVFALAPLATAARNEGHQVIVASIADMIPVIATSGLPAVSVTDMRLVDFVSKDREGNPVHRGTDETLEEQGAAIGRWFGRMAAASLDSLMELAEDWRPDMVVGGMLCYAAPLLATRIGVPFVRHAWDAYEPTTVDPGANEELRPELRALGLERLPDPRLWIEICPPSLLPPETQGATMMRCFPGNAQSRLEPWMYRQPTRPRVCVTAGSQATPEGNFEYLRNLARAVAASGAEVVMAAPEELAAALRTEFPDMLTGWIPLDTIAPTCDAIVHHCGGLTSINAFNSGIPQLFVPRKWHYSVVGAQRVSRFGAGITALPEDEDFDVTAACEELLSEPSYRERAGELMAETQVMPTPADLVKTLEKMESAGR